MNPLKIAREKVIAAACSLISTRVFQGVSEPNTYDDAQEEMNEQILDDAIGEYYLARKNERWTTSNPRSNTGTTRLELRALCALYMADDGDSKVLNADDDVLLLNWLDEQAQQHGFKSWVDAYHSIGIQG